MLFTTRNIYACLQVPGRESWFLLYDTLDSLCISHSSSFKPLYAFSFLIFTDT